MNKSILILNVLFSVFLFSCKKNQLGGKSVISGTVVHHSKAIANATIYIKFNAKDSPGNDVGVYDTKVLADANGSYSINCYKGDYYLYAYGIDNAITPDPTVVGGIPVHVRNNEKTTQIIAVTEKP